jgi:predicted transposase YdaD
LAKPFDATTKELLERHPRAWLEFLLGRRLGEVRVVDADLSTITSESDKVFRVGGSKPWMVHVELVSSRDPNLELRIQRYNILVRCRHQLPVQSVIVLLRRQADSSGLSGKFEDHLPSGFLYHDFRYNVVRVWELPPKKILSGNIATLPLAPIARVSPTELRTVIKRMEKRFDTEADPHEIPDLWAATYVLMGLVYPDDYARTLLEGVRKMKESSTYRAILREGKAEGKVEEAKRILMRQGRIKFGQPKAAVKSRIEAIGDLVRLELLTDRVLDAESWDDLIAGV